MQKLKVPPFPSLVLLVLTRHSLALSLGQDKQFGKVALFFPHANPEAEITCDIKHYKQYTLRRAYLGETFYWGLLPQPGDHLIFKFATPIPIKRYIDWKTPKAVEVHVFFWFCSYLFKSGNAEHPSDKFYNTTVEVLPVAAPRGHSLFSSNLTGDGFVVVGKSVVVVAS